MNKCSLFLSILFGMILVACGGGGGGGGGTDTGSTTINTLEYFSKDNSKTYTYSVTNVDANTQATTTSTLVYSYENAVTIPDKFNHDGSVAGPYYLETQLVNNTAKTMTYISVDGIAVVMDDLTIHLYTDNTHTTSTGNMPAVKTIGQEYSYNSTQDLMVSDSNYGTVGDIVGTMITEYTVTVVGMENITVNNVSYEAVKTQETTYSKTTTSQFISETDSSSTVWYGKNIGPVRMVSTQETSITDGTITESGTSTVTSELIKVE